MAAAHHHLATVLQSETARSVVRCLVTCALDAALARTAPRTQARTGSPSAAGKDGCRRT